MGWELVVVTDIEWRKDCSGVYVLVNWRHKHINSIRVDVMSDKHEPLISFTGSADAVRKHCMRWFVQNDIAVSLTHAAYIGQQLEKATHLQTEYVQD